MATNLSHDDTARLENVEARLCDLEALARRIDPSSLLPEPEPVKVETPSIPATLDAETAALLKALLGKLGG